MRISRYAKCVSLEVEQLELKVFLIIYVKKIFLLPKFGFHRGTKVFETRKFKPKFSISEDKFVCFVHKYRS
jgi:hypothetical protein